MPSWIQFFFICVVGNTLSTLVLLFWFKSYLHKKLFLTVVSTVKPKTSVRLSPLSALLVPSNGLHTEIFNQVPINSPGFSFESSTCPIHSPDDPSCGFNKKKESKVKERGIRKGSVEGSY